MGPRCTPINVMFDSGCSSVAALTEAMDSINVQCYSLPCKLSTFDKNDCGIRDFADFQILSLDRKICVNIKGALIGDVLTAESDRPPRNEDVIPYKYLDGVIFEELSDPTIGVILGAP